MRCNGYYYICKYKGKVVAEGSIEWKNKKSKLMLCAKCLKEYFKQHPEVNYEVIAKNQRS